MVAVGPTFVLCWKFRTKIDWFFIVFGALAWLISVILKGIASLPARSIISCLKMSFPRYIAEPISWLYSGLMAGIFECGVALAFVYNKRVRNSTWQEAVGFGIGFGSFEAIIVGLVLSF